MPATNVTSNQSVSPAKSIVLTTCAPTAKVSVVDVSPGIVLERGSSANTPATGASITNPSTNCELPSRLISMELKKSFGYSLFCLNDFIASNAKLLNISNLPASKKALSPFNVSTSKLLKTFLFEK